jgi:hypothetical protein
MTDKSWHASGCPPRANFIRKKILFFFTKRVDFKVFSVKLKEKHHD